MPHDKVELYEKLLATIPVIERKGATMPDTSINGNMFTFFDKEGRLNLRLPEEKRDEFKKKFKAAQSVQHGVEMKEYVSVPDKLLAVTKELRPWLQASYDYAVSLKPKSTKKSAKKK
jgi:TfoX/Sxy family transcriptional regulator of competence genes